MSNSQECCLAIPLKVVRSKVYISNAFSLSMVPGDAVLLVKKINDPANYIKWIGLDFEVVSCVGHENTAKLYSKILDYDVECNRVSVKAEYCDRIFVGQYIGPRLPEGATELPEGARIEWYEVYVGHPDSYVAKNTVELGMRQLEEENRKLKEKYEAKIQQMNRILDFVYSDEPEGRRIKVEEGEHVWEPPTGEELIAYHEKKIEEIKKHYRI